MPSGLEFRSGAGRISALALLMLAVSGLAVGSAPGGWEPARASSEGFGRVRITGDRVTGLYPGAKRTLTLTLHNSDSSDNVVVRRVRIRDIRTTKHGCAPSRRNLRIAQARAAELRIRAGGTRRLGVLLVMPNTVADACQQAVFRLRFKAETASAP